MMTLGTESPRGKRRVIHTSDGGSYFASTPNARGDGTHIYSDPARPEELQQWIRNLAAGGADTYVPEVYCDGWYFFFRGEVCPWYEDDNSKRFIPMMDSGTMPLEIFVDEAHRQGMELLAGFRMNDRHGMHKSFFEEHKDWMLKDLGYGVDYSLPEVRDWIFSIAKEVPHWFDVDGLEFNFIRAGYCFPPATASEQHPIMTGFMRRVRKMLDELGEKRGRHLLLGARVPTTLEQCRHFGFDVPTWVADKLIDYIAPTDFHCTDFNVKYEEFAEVARSSDSCYLYPAVQPDLPGNCAVMSLDNFRAAVQNLYGAGADGFSTHNYDAYMWGQLRNKGYPGTTDMYPKALAYFRTLRDPQAVADGDRHYLFFPVFPHELRPHGYRGCAVPHRRAVLKRSGLNRRAEYWFRICEHLPESVELPMGARGLYEGLFNKAGKVPGVWLIFRAMGMRPGDEIAVDINGQEMPAENIRHVWHQEGRPGWEGRPLPPYTECQLSLTAPPGVYGDNYLGLKLLRSANGAEEDLVVDELEVMVHLDH